MQLYKKAQQLSQRVHSIPLSTMFSRLVFSFSVCVLLWCCTFTLSTPLHHHATSLQRSRRQAFRVPAGAKEVVGKEINTSFKCPGNGYYADVQNDCKLFHVCLNQKKSGGQSELSHHTMLCGEKTQFDQSSLVCRHEDDAIPCDASPMFFDLNERIGEADQPFLTDADIDRAKVARPDFR